VLFLKGKKLCVLSSYKLKCNILKFITKNNSSCSC